jgi:HEAT repeat protein
LITRLLLVGALLAGCGSEPEANRFAGEHRREVLRELIAEVRDPETAPALIALLQHPDAGVRYAAAAKHWELTGVEEPGLRLLLDGIVRGDEAAVLALAPGTYPETFVARLLQKPVGLRSIQALGAIEARDAEPLLLEILDGPASTGSGRRPEAAWSLFRIDRAHARRALTVLLPAYRKGTVFTRGRLASRIAAIGAVEPEPVSEFVAALLADPDEDARAAGKYLREQITPR